ncbi:hypothetical protein CPB84DRAFT_1753204 [Gymnopilus junonius]|uniref:Uncharacterized protein n=1 Tax=Gymnopilus junonius TaxID=109634 RepID=A0A9P5N832_GYMJU|nr:hypothetical protein CPB84DRAFT_1753204 [Gymnopilus junonius]
MDLEKGNFKVLINIVDLVHKHLFGMAEKLVPDMYNLGNVEGIIHTLHILNEQTLDSQWDLLELPDYLRCYNAVLPNNRTTRVLAFTDGCTDTQIYSAIREFTPGKSKGRGNSCEDLRSLFKMFLVSLLHRKKDDYAGLMLMKMMEDWQKYNLSSPPLKKFTLEEDNNFFKFYNININASVLAEDLIHVVAQWQEEVRGTVQLVQGEFLTAAESVQSELPTAFAKDLIYYKGVPGSLSDLFLS